MKNLFIFLLLLFSIQTFSQIKTRGSIELGFEDRLVRLKDDKGTDYANSWLREKEFVDIHMAASYKKFTLYTNIKTYFECERFYRYNPLQAEYTLGLSYKLKWVEFGYEHMCSHTIKYDFLHESYDRFSAKSTFWEKTNSRIKTRGSIELGYEERIVRLNNGLNLAGIYTSGWLKNKGFVDINLNGIYKRFSIYTNVKTYFEYEKIYRYNPVQVEYYLGATYKLKWIEFGWKHLCSHSLKSDVFHEASDMFSVKFTFNNIEK